MRTQALAAVNNAFVQAKPVIFNSDQGSRFASPQYLSLLEQAEVEISMDGKGRATGNIFTERLWRSLKYEEVYLHDYLTPLDARPGTGSNCNIWLMASGWSINRLSQPTAPQPAGQQQKDGDQ